MKNETDTELAVLGGKPVRQRPFCSTAIIGDEERKRVNQVLDSGLLSGFIANASDAFYGGPQVREFEAQVKAYFGLDHAVAVNSATAGLHAALAACGVGPGDEVIVTPYTMSASATAIVMCGAVPVFADIEEDFFGLDPECVEKRITSRTRAIVAVHLFGNPARIKDLAALAKRRGLRLIEDCAQSPGARLDGRLTGTFGDAGVFSLNQHKTITCGEGGFVITADDDIARRMQLIRNHGEVIAEKMGVDRIDNIIGYNYRMTELEAAVANGQFRRLDELNARRSQLAEYLTGKLSQFPGLRLPRPASGGSHVYFVYPIVLDEGAFGVTRDDLVRALVAEGVPFGAGYVRPIYREPMYQQQIGHGRDGFPFTSPVYQGKTDYRPQGLCPVAERLHERELLMTGVCRAPHTEADMDDVVAAFEKVYRNREQFTLPAASGVSG